MEHVNRIGKPYRVDRSVRIAVMTLPDFNFSRRAKLFECPCLSGMALAHLCEKQCISHLALHGPPGTSCSRVLKTHTTPTAWVHGSYHVRREYVKYIIIDQGACITAPARRPRRARP